MSARRRWIPSWAQTIRFRLTVTYSGVLFGLAALVLGGVYWGVSSTVESRPLNTIQVETVYRDENGKLKIKPGETVEAATVESFEAVVNYQTLQTLRTYSLLALGGLFILSLLIGWWLSGRVLRPVSRITATAQQISATDLSQRIDLDGPRDELRTLADTLDGMLSRLDQAFDAQRQMVDDASHELRNPLAVIQANLDAVLTDDASTDEERAQAVSVVARATTRMTHLVEDLLASARRRSPAFTDVDVDLAEIAGDAAEEYQVLARERNLRVTRRLAAGPVAAGDPQALRRAMDNLLSNAVRLAPSGTELVVAVGSVGGWAWMAVRDDGPGIAESDQERVFDRFYRSATTRSQADAGHHPTGLGLAIVRQIVESHGGAVALHSVPGVGSTFVLWVPDRARPDSERSATAPATDPLGRLSTPASRSRLS